MGVVKSKLLKQISNSFPNFQKKDYPFETELEKNERQEAIIKEGGWGITTVQSGTGSIENTMEVPLIPSTNKGLKFDAAAKELKLINDKLVSSAHDISSGGLIIALSEMSIGNKIGVKINKPHNLMNLTEYFFGEDQGRYILEINEENLKITANIIKLI